MKFSKNHMWVEKTETSVKVGLTDYAQAKLRLILFVNLPDIGEQFVAGDIMGDIESVKTVSDLIAPVSGKVIAVNEDLVDEPDQINEAPYEAWLVEVDSDLPDDLLTEEEYKKFLGSL